MSTKLQKWGNSLAVRIPREVTRRLALKEGSNIVVHHDRDAITIRKEGPHDHPGRKNDWKRYLIPKSHKKENVSGTIDRILYGASR